MYPQDAQSRIISKATQDPEFCDALRKNAVAAIERELGVKLPSGFSVKVVEDTATTVHLVLPPTVARGELSDVELDRIAAAGNAGEANYVRCAGPEEINLNKPRM